MAEHLRWQRSGGNLLFTSLADAVFSDLANVVAVDLADLA
jgi:hypothetical protein